MFGSTVLEIIIILVFVYLIYSLLTTIVVEIIASVFRLRARNLRFSILRMLQDSHQHKFWSFEGLKHFVKSFFLRTYHQGTLVKAFFNRPSIKYLGQDKVNKTPSYLEPQVFSKTLLDILRKEAGSNDIESIKTAIGYSDFFDKSIILEGDDWSEFKNDFIKGSDKNKKNPIKDWLTENRSIRDVEKVEFTEEELKEQLSKMTSLSAKDKNAAFEQWKKGLSNGIDIEPETRQHLCSLFKDSGEDIDEFKVQLESWFKQTMDRSKGWYKKKIALITLMVGLFVAVSFNVDTIFIAQELKTNTAKRDSILLQIENFQKSPPSSLSTNVVSSDPNNELGEIDELSSVLVENTGSINESLSLSNRRNWSNNWFLAILGWILTAIAISFGAPFWFDLLNKLMQLRSSVRLKPEKENSKSDDDTSSTEGFGVKRMG